MNNREKNIDVVAGLMILWMVVGHAQQIVGHEFGYPNILFFFMPWFYYKSGMLSKPKGLIEQVNGGWRKFSKPFVIYGLFGQIVLTLCLLVEHEHNVKPYLYTPMRSLFIGGTLSGNPPLWFLTSLFVTLCLFAWLSEKKVHIGIIAAIGLAGALISNRINSQLFPVYISSGLYGLFFFGMGKILYKYQKHVIVFFVSAIVVAGLYLWYGLPNIEWHYISQCGGTILDFFVWTAMALCGCVIVTYLFGIAQQYLRFPILQYIGRNAMVFYVLHWIILLIAIRLIMGDMLDIQSVYAQLAVGLMSCAIIIPLFIFIKIRIKLNDFHKQNEPTY